MTVKRSLFVGLEDIKSVLFACNKCEATVSVSPDNIGVIPPKCPRCGYSWNVSEEVEVNADSSFQDFVNAMGKIRLLGNKTTGFRILLEFDDASKQ